MVSFWTPQLNAVLGSLVVAVGAWLASDAMPGLGALVVMIAAAIFLLWHGRTISLVWAWSTLFLGLECFAWPLIMMVKIRSGTSEPSDEEMSTILSAVLMGLFSAVFWVAFSYGLFKRVGGEEPGTTAPSPEQTSPSLPSASSRPRKKR